MITLKKVLFVNGASSSVTAIGLIAFPEMIAEIFHISNPSIFVGVGVFLLAFASIVLLEAGSAVTNLKRVQFIIALDVMWVIASIIVVVSTLNVISTIGHSLVVGVALWVGAMAYLQAKGLNQVTA